MAIDPRIPLGVDTAIPGRISALFSPERFADLAAKEQAQQINALKLRADEQALNEAQQYKDLMRGVRDFNQPQAVAGKLFAGGLPTQGAEWLKYGQEQNLRNLQTKQAESALGVNEAQKTRENLQSASQGLMGLIANPSDAALGSYFNWATQNGLMTPEAATELGKQIPQEPNARRQWILLQNAKVAEALQLLGLENARPTGSVSEILKLQMDREWARSHGYDPTPYDKRIQKLTEGQVPAMGATLQRELFATDQGVLQNRNALEMLDQASALNEKALAGIGAMTAAKAFTQVPGARWVGKQLGVQEAANATIDLDNLMTGQALEVLRATFGSMPTEGERKVLLDMQASSEKTPAQKQAILARAKRLTQMRIGFNDAKQKAIRGGTYLKTFDPDYKRWLTTQNLDAFGNPLMKPNSTKATTGNFEILPE